MKKLLLALTLLAAPAFAADPTYYNDKLVDLSKSEPADGEQANTIGAWIRKVASSLYDWGLTEHNATGGHQNLTLFGRVTNSVAPYSISLAANTNGSLWLFTGAETNTVQLPSAAAAGVGRFFGVKRADGNTNAIFITRTGTDLLEGGTALSITNANQSMLLVSDGGTNWHNLLAGFGGGGGAGSGVGQWAPNTNQNRILCNIDGTTRAISSLSCDAGGTVTLATSTAHGWSDGYQIYVAFAAIAAYNGHFIISNTTPTTCQYSVPPGTSSPSGGSPAVYTAIRSQSGIASVTKPGTGRYLFNFASPYMLNSNFIAQVSSGVQSQFLPTSVYATHPIVRSRSSNSVEVIVYSYGGTSPTDYATDINLTIAAP